MDWLFLKREGIDTPQTIVPQTIERGFEAKVGHKNRRTEQMAPVAKCESKDPPSAPNY